MTDIILPTLCSCGHAEGYHDARSLETDDRVEVCAVCTRPLSVHKLTERCYA